MLRPNNAEITTTAGYFRTPDICEIELNKTYHVAMVYDGATLKFYRNGYLMSQVAVTGDMIQNNWATRVGYYEAGLHPTNFIGYINEVRIWNVARTQTQIRTYMNSSLPNPPTQTGLLAYYTFNSLANKQGNSTYDLSLSANANINTTNPTCPLVIDSCGTVVSPIAPDNPKIISTSDTTICAGAATTLRTMDGLGFSWTPTAFLDDPLSANPVTTTPDNITYIVETKIPGDNIVVNGDFSQGNTGFTSQYDYVNVNTFESEYFISNSPYSWNKSFSNCGDHTLGNGNMMLVNGSPLGGQVVWNQIVSVTPNTDYAFSSWIQALHPENPALLVFSVNDAPIGPPIEPVIPPCTWKQFHATWNSGTHTLVKISIFNVNPQYLGNDFALDDISFAPYFIVKDTVHISVMKPLVKTINDTTICNGTKVRLNASGGIKYTWLTNTSLSSTSIPNPVAAPNTNTEYIVSGTDSKGCIAKDSVTVFVKPKPAVTLTPDSLLCSNIPLQLNASGGQQYSWQPASGLSDPAIPNPIATINKSTVYKVSVTGANGCTNTDSLQLNIRPYPNFQISDEQQICIGKDVQLNASGGDKFEWSSTENIADPFAAIIIAHPAVSTTYNVHITESNCNNDTTMSVNVSVQPSPLVTVRKSNDINCNTPSAQLFVSGAVNYSWSPATGLDDAGSNSPIVTFDSTISYDVTGTNEFGCSSTEHITVNASKGGIPRFVVPNAFTPNGDNKNDCFGIRRWGSAVIKQFSVFNRWGQLVFQTSDPSQCWDGTFKGKPVASGAYAYIISAFTICGEVTRKGLVTLIR